MDQRFSSNRDLLAQKRKADEKMKTRLTGDSLQVNKRNWQLSHKALQWESEF